MREVTRLTIWAVMMVMTAFCSVTHAGRLELLGTNVVSLGTYPNSEDRTAHVRIKNSGDTPLRIERVITTCKCMRVDAFPKQLAPDEEGEVAVSIMRNEIAGSFERIFYIDANDPDNRSLKVAIVGHATPLFDVICDAPTSLGPVDAGLVWTGRYTLVATEPGITLSSPLVRNQGARCDFTVHTNCLNKMVYEVVQTVTFEGDGLMESKLIFPVFGKEGEKAFPVQLLVEAVRKKPLKTAPGKILLPLSGGPVKRRLLLSFDVSAPIDPNLLRCQTDLGEIKVFSRLTASGKGLMIDLVFSEAMISEFSRTRNARLTLKYADWSVDVPIQEGK